MRAGDEGQQLRRTAARPPRRPAEPRPAGLARAGVPDGRGPPPALRPRPRAPRRCDGSPTDGGRSRNSSARRAHPARAHRGRGHGRGARHPLAAFSAAGSEGARPDSRPTAQSRQCGGREGESPSALSARPPAPRSGPWSVRSSARWGSRREPWLRCSGCRPHSASEYGEPSWARLAAELDYVDQPHLNREFRRDTGLPPRALLESLGPLATAFVARAAREPRGSVQDTGPDLRQDEPALLLPVTSMIPSPCCSSRPRPSVQRSGRASPGPRPARLARRRLVRRRPRHAQRGGLARPLGRADARHARDTAGGKATGFEFLRIEQDGTPSSTGRCPRAGRPPTSAGSRRARPASSSRTPSTPSPGAILYWRDGATLHARIEGTRQGSRPRTSGPGRRRPASGFDVTATWASVPRWRPPCRDPRSSRPSPSR